MGRSNLIKNVLNPSHVTFIEESSKQAALNKLAALLGHDKCIHDPQELTEAIFRREEMMSTGIGLGIGVPHVRLASIDDIIMAVGVCRRPIEDYESLDNKPVSIICMIAANIDRHTEHIRLLSAVSQLLKDEPRRNRILSAATVQEVYDIFTG